MTQYARPNSDVADAEWVNVAGDSADLYLLIDEAVASDSDYMKSVSDGSTSPADCKIALANTVTDPDTELSNHQVMYRAIGFDNSGMMMGVPTLIVSLYDTTVSTSTPIVTYTNNELQDEGMWGSWAEFTIPLNEDQAGNILSYDDLQIWFKRGEVGSDGDYAKVSQAWFQCADAPAGGGAAATSPAFLLFME